METLRIVFPTVVLIGFIIIFVKILMKIRKGGGSILTVCSGATDEFLTQDRKKAVEVVVEKNAGMKIEEQSSSEPKRKDEQK